MNVKKLNNREISGFCLELSLLIHSGVGIGDGLALLAEEESDASQRELCKQLSESADRGINLADSVRECGRFPDYVCGLLEVGEKSGRTEEALTALSRYYEDRARLDRQVRSALLYPSVLLVIMLAVIGVLLIKVLPVFNEVYSYLGASLSGIAGGLLSLGKALDAAMPFLCVLLGLVVLFLILFAAAPSFREKITGIWRRYMGDRGVSGKINTACFAQSLSMGLSSGLPVDEALELAGSLLDGVPAAKARCDDCRKRLEDGESLSSAMKESGTLPNAECRILEIGLRSGTGDTAMEQIARRLSEESDAALEESVARVEPALVMVTSVLVGIILLAVMLPLMNIMTAIG